MGTRAAIKISKHVPSVFQGSLHFTSRTISISVEHPNERLLMRGLLIAIAVLLCSYLYFVSASVLNVIARKEAVAQVNTMQSSISKMEQQYFALSQRITPSAGSALGLAPVDKPSYVHRPGNAAAVTITANREI